MLWPHHAPCFFNFSRVTCAGHFHIPLVRVTGPGHEARAHQLMKKAMWAYSRGEMPVLALRLWLAGGATLHEGAPEPLVDWDGANSARQRLWRNPKEIRVRAAPPSRTAAMSRPHGAQLPPVTASSAGSALPGHPASKPRRARSPQTRLKAAHLQTAQPAPKRSRRLSQRAQQALQAAEEESERQDRAALKARQTAQAAREQAEQLERAWTAAQAEQLERARTAAQKSPLIARCTVDEHLAPPPAPRPPVRTQGPAVFVTPPSHRPCQPAARIASPHGGEGCLGPGGVDGARSPAQPSHTMATPATGLTVPVVAMPTPEVRAPSPTPSPLPMSVRASPPSGARYLAPERRTPAGFDMEPGAQPAVQSTAAARATLPTTTCPSENFRLVGLSRPAVVLQEPAAADDGAMQGAPLLSRAEPLQSQGTAERAPGIYETPRMRQTAADCLAVLSDKIRMAEEEAHAAEWQARRWMEYVSVYRRLHQTLSSFSSSLPPPDMDVASLHTPRQPMQTPCLFTGAGHDSTSLGQLVPSNSLASFPWGDVADSGLPSAADSLLATTQSVGQSVLSGNDAWNDECGSG